MRAIDKPAGEQVKNRIVRTLPFFDTTVNAGFPSPAQDYHENEITPEELIGMTPTTFLVRVSGPSMEGAHIPHGCVVAVDRSAKPSAGSIVVALLNGEFTIKRLVRSHAGWILHAENPSFTPYVVKDEDQFDVWGVVKAIVIKP
ncbi:translesion error-prone DNA polymerase V autoproteolytic subunit [Chitinophaga sp. YIM B06452]|uniref:LexA family protein n=1 Tax=Chitinophaga sp. YIM B06452 TaxID=3082158 RepID=UPI0031FF26DC